MLTDNLTKTFLLAVGMAALAMPALSQDASRSAAYKLFHIGYNEICMLDEPQAAADYYPPQSWALEWETDYSDTPQTATLYEFFCGAGAYNVQLVYFLEDEYSGPRPLSFAAPYFDVKYVGDDFEGEVEAIDITGFQTQDMLTNPSFDPETMTITNSAHWRGIGDASSSGTWVFEDGIFVLKSYDVDASYDGEINPTRIVEYP